MNTGPVYYTPEDLGVLDWSTVCCEKAYRDYSPYWRVAQ